MDRFRAIASSTARNCFNNSSRRVVFFEFDSDLDPVKCNKRNIASSDYERSAPTNRNPPEVFDELFFSDAVLSCRLFDPCFARLFADVSDEPESDDSESEPLELDESELDEWLERFSLPARRAPELCGLAGAVAPPPRRDDSTAGGGELAFLRFSG